MESVLFLLTLPRHKLDHKFYQLSNWYGLPLFLVSQICDEEFSVSGYNISRYRWEQNWANNTCNWASSYFSETVYMVYTTASGQQAKYSLLLYECMFVLLISNISPYSELLSFM